MYKCNVVFGEGLTIRKFIVSGEGNEPFMHRNICAISHMIMICNSQRSVLLYNYNTAKVSQFIFLRLVISGMLAINCMKLRCIGNHKQAAKYCTNTIQICQILQHCHSCQRFAWQYAYRWHDMTCVSLMLRYRKVEEQNIGNVLLNKDVVLLSN